MSGPLRLRHRVLESVRRRRLWEPGQRVVVACSGGRDSVVLLDLLHLTAGAHRARLEVLTIDHGQREGSAADARFVVEMAEARGLGVQVVAVQPDGGSEDAMRRARHQVFRERVADGALVALGHHRRDQAETLLLQLLRGGGGRARRAMLPARDGLVRPLLEVPPDELAAWAVARGLRWREDPTNTSSDLLRNRVRHEVLPLLESLRAGAEATLARSARLAALDEACLEAQAAALPLEVGPLGEASEALARRALRRRWPSLSAGQVDALLAAVRAGEGEVALGGGRSAVVGKGAVEERAVGDLSGVVTDSEPARAEGSAAPGRPAEKAP